MLKTDKKKYNFSFLSYYLLLSLLFNASVGCITYLLSKKKNEFFFERDQSTTSLFNAPMILDKFLTE